MRKLVCIVGETASGKDFVARYLRKAFGLKDVCSHTTRPPREGEINGREHWFNTQEEFDSIRATEKICAYTKIEKSNSGSVGYEYCATLEDVQSADLYIIDPNGIDYLETHFPEISLLIIYIDASKEIRKARALSRDKSQEKAFEARYDNEHEQFERFRNNGAWDYVVVNENISESALCATVRDIMVQEGFTQVG